MLSHSSNHEVRFVLLFFRNRADKFSRDLQRSYLYCLFVVFTLCGFKDSENLAANSENEGRNALSLAIKRKGETGIYTQFIFKKQ